MIFENIPIPPSTNQLYAGKSVRHKSTKYKNWQHEFLLWVLKNQGSVLGTRRIVREHFNESPDNFLKLGIQINVPASIIFTKDGRNKKIDATNFIKALFDNVADELGVDDNRFFLSNCEFVCYDNLDICPNVTIIFDKCKLRRKNHGKSKKEKDTTKSRNGKSERRENRNPNARHKERENDPKTKWFRST